MDCFYNNLLIEVLVVFTVLFACGMFYIISFVFKTARIKLIMEKEKRVIKIFLNICLMSFLLFFLMIYLKVNIFIILNGTILLFFSSLNYITKFYKRKKELGLG